MGAGARPARITDAERWRLTETMCKNYEKGASLRELARDSGRCYGFVHSALTEAGVTLRGRGGSRTSK